MPNTRTLSDKELIEISHHWRREALAGSAHALAEAQRHEAELRRRFREIDQSMSQNEPAETRRTSSLTESATLTPAVQNYIFATADSATQSVEALRDLLYNLRVVLQMDIAFVAEFVAGKKIYRQISSADEAKLRVAPGDSAALETTLCQHVVDGRLPQMMKDVRAEPDAANLAAVKALDIGAYLTTPVVLGDGSVYGTLCCISHAPRSALGSRQLDSLRYVAGIVATELDKNR